MVETKMVRLQKENHEKLVELATADNIALAEELRRLIDAAWRRRVLEDTNRHYAELRADTDAWTAELAERALWDTTLADGLDDELYLPTDGPT